MRDRTRRNVQSPTSLLGDSASHLARLRRRLGPESPTRKRRGRGDRCHDPHASNADFATQTAGFVLPGLTVGLHLLHLLCLPPAGFFQGIAESSHLLSVVGEDGSTGFEGAFVLKTAGFALGIHFDGLRG